MKRKIGWIVPLLAAVTANAIEIRSDYPGGNVKVEKIDDAAGVVTLAPDLRG